jgi:pimeloyl-ACP methyl ester carboxylesterase
VTATLSIKSLRFLSVPKLLSTAALLTSSVVYAQELSPTPPPKIPQALRLLPLTKFYDTPDPLPAGKPGELIRSEPFYDYRLSYEVSAVRILYHSRSSDAGDVAASGVVLLPNGTPPAGGWPIIAWAHDFTGAARPCAPSLLKNLNEGPLLSMYAGLGYAVVASDYAGLGTTFPHAALDIRSNALDVINSISAARAALQQLASRWVVAGFARGSLVAIAVAEAESEIADPNYLGAIGISGIGQPQELFEHLAHSPSYFMLVFLAKGIKTVFPKFRIEDMLTDKAIRLYQYVSHSCDAASGPVPAASEMLKSGWQDNPYVKEFFARNALGQRPAYGPLLLISSDSDADVPAALSASTVARLRQQNDRVLLVKYKGISASTILGDSVSEQISWTHARFAGLPAPANPP